LLCTGAFFIAELCASNGFAKPEASFGLTSALPHAVRMSLILLIVLSPLHSNNAQPCCGFDILSYRQNSWGFFREIALKFCICASTPCCTTQKACLCPVDQYVFFIAERVFDVLWSKLTLEI
jgi:hypothetical protein